ncbi:hypothetical protein H9P43_007294 [Blastocladiella emersonii ATCC 22665]|nr:hypothetical protein H9P43_007294 [Blastocladiella emersonii ATCC 22665]
MSTNVPTTSTSATKPLRKHPELASQSHEPAPSHHAGQQPHAAVVGHASMADQRRQEMREDLTEELIKHQSHPHHKASGRAPGDPAWAEGEHVGLEQVSTTQVREGEPPIVGHVQALDEAAAASKGRK